jgi:hypothetical protein
MAGYIRQSSFVDGDTITAALFNNEYNQLLNAFNNATGHAHDGTAAEGPVIGLIGDAGETAPNNKVLIDTTNNFIEFYVEVSSAPVQQLYISDGAIIPVTDSDVDLGTSSLYFKNAYIDSITTTGNIDVGGNLTVTGTTTFNGGTITMGDAATDNVVFGADINSSIIPNTDDTYDLGSSSQEWRNLYIDGTANIDSLVADTADINAGTIDGATIATSDITVGSGKTLDVSAGTLTLADDQISGDKVEGGTIAATTVTALTFGSLNDGTITVTAFVDEDNMASDSATLIPTQQSVKAYVDTTVAATNEVVEDTTPQLGGDLDTNGNDILFADNDKAIFGAGSDLQIFHNATDSYIVDTGTGNLNIKGSNLYLRANNNDAFIYGIEDGPVRIYHDNVEKFITTATGIDVTGNTESDTVTIGVSSVAGSEKLRVNGTVLTLGGSVSAPAIGIGDTNTGVYAPSAGELGWTVNGTQRLFLDSTGINVTGTATMDGLTVDVPTTTDIIFQRDGGTNGKLELDFGAGFTNFNSVIDGFKLYHNGTQALQIRYGDISFYNSAGTSQALFWDASAESLGIGTTSTLGKLTISDGTNPLAIDSGTYSEIQSYNRPLLLNRQGNNVGIGTTSPANALTVNSGTTNTVAQFISTDSGAGILLTDNVGSSSVQTTDEVLRIGVDEDAAVASSAIAFRVDGNEKVRIDSSGNVGIGTTSPFSKLHVGSRGSASVLSYGSSGDGIVFDFYNLAGSPYTRYANIVSSSSDTSESRLGLWTQAASGTSSEKLTILGDGNVGIGTSSPTFKLEVAGNVKLGATNPMQTATNAVHGTSGQNGFLIRTAVSNAANPSYSNIDDTNTGMFLPGSDIVGFTTGGTERFRIAADGSLSTSTLGTSNVRFGVNAGNSIESGGNYNVVVGDEAGTAITTGDNNTAVGYASLDANTTASNNTAVGYLALTANTTGAENTAVGKGALDANTTASYNAAFGSNALGANTTGASNTAIGISALTANTTASNNTAVGTSSLVANTTGSNNTALGYAALDANTTASNNTAVGKDALTANTTGTANVAVGGFALDANTTANSNTAVGYSALTANTTGTPNTAVGYESLYSNVTGANNTGLGYYALRLNTGDNNTAVGHYAASGNTSGTRVIAVGGGTLSATNTGGFLVAIGTSALNANTSGNYNVAVGDSALEQTPQLLTTQQLVIML